MQAVILAGGKGTRLRPFTLLQPKPLLPLLDIPFLVWMVERCRQTGITDVIFSLGYLGDRIESFFKAHETGDMTLHFVHETTPLDTAGGMLLAKPYYNGDPLLVFNADILTDLDLSALMERHRSSGATATLTLTRVEDITAFGLVETDDQGRIVSFREKPSAGEAATITTDTINAGTYVVDPTVFEPYSVGDPLSYERQVFPDLLAAGHPMVAHIHEGYWRDLGKPASYYDGQLDILTGSMSDYPLPEVEQIKPGIWVHRTAEVDPAAQLESPCYVGSQAKIGADAVLPAGTLVCRCSWINRRLEPGVYAPGTLAV
jgi:NDP-sugar pyrophosphorylase family protein